MRRAALRAWPCDLSAPSLLQRLRVRCFLVTLMLACALPMPSAQANLVVTDDSGHVLALPRVAERIVSLAPHTTELLFAAGAGSKIVGVSEFSDYPSEATKLPSVGSSMQLDIERIVALKPDLIIAWQSGNHARQVERLRKLGYPVFYSEPHRLDDIASTLEKLGTLAGSEQGPRAARAFRQRHQALVCTSAC